MALVKPLNPCINLWYSKRLEYSHDAKLWKNTVSFWTHEIPPNITVLSDSKWPVMAFGRETVPLVNASRASKALNGITDLGLKLGVSIPIILSRCRGYNLISDVD